MMSEKPPLVGVIMGSDSDWPAMIQTSDILSGLNIPSESLVMSAHRTPERTQHYALTAQMRGIRVIIAGAGGAAHLAGFVAALTPLPVLGVPMKTDLSGGLDSLLSTVQMPRGIPVATFATGPAGPVNAALFAAAILALSDETIARALDDYRRKQTNDVPIVPSARSLLHRR